MVDFLENKDLLLQFFHRHKTEMACIEKPRTFLTKMRDYNLVPEDRYQRMIRTKSKPALKNSLYDFLDWLEKKRPERIHVFWEAAFTDVMVENYPILRKLQHSLMEEMVHLGNKTEEKARDERRWEECSENEKEEERNTTPVKRKMGKVKGSPAEKKEKESKPSCVESPLPSRKSSKVQMSTPLKKGEKSDIWMWPLYQVQMPVRCGEKEGVLDKKRMAKGEKCIVHNKRWFDLTEFEKFAGKDNCRKWKETIKCMGTPLGKLIQEGHLKWAESRHRTGEARKSLFAAPVVITDDEDESSSEESDSDARPSTSEEQRSARPTEEEPDEEAEQEPEVLHVSNTVFNVTCGSEFGALHKERFASGTCGKCIRTETSWMTPVEFVEAALDQADIAWKRDIQWEGKPINDLIMAKILMVHSLMCDCPLCKPNPEERENQRNDDECWVCKRREDQLVECDECPRSFHQKCHIPHIEDAVCRDSGQWLCTFCVFKTNQEYFYRHERSREEAMSCDMAQHKLECQYLLLRLCSDEEHVVAPGSGPFLDQELDQELDISAVREEIRMRLSPIVDKLQGPYYPTVGHFVSNLKLVLASCTSQNQDAALIAVGNRLEQMFDEDLKNVFSVVR